MNGKAPCKGCEDRQVGCHIDCPKYKEYHDKNVKWYHDTWEAKKKYKTRMGWL